MESSGVNGDLNIIKFIFKVLQNSGYTKSTGFPLSMHSVIYSVNPKRFVWHDLSHLK